MTALAATFQAGTTTDPASVLLQVTAAPSITPPYTGVFTVGNVDGWTGTAGTTLAYASTYLSGGVMIPSGLRLTTAAETTSTFSRTVGGLTIGQTYVFHTMAISGGGKIRLGVSGMTADPYTTPVGRAPISYTFTATATSHVIQVTIQPPSTTGTDYGVYRLDTVQVSRGGSGWLGTTIARTDANGTNPVRLGWLQDTAGVSGSAVMTVTDYEAALTGTVSYTVTDGLGATATATVTNPAAPGVWLTLPATSDPAAPAPPANVQAQLVTAFEESSDSNGSLHKIIDRADLIGNPGPLMLRAGTVQVWCTDYTAAKAVRTLLAGGDVAHLRQPTFPGMDLYLIGTRVGIRPEQATEGAQRWMVALEYQEQVAP